MKSQIGFCRTLLSHSSFFYSTRWYLDHLSNSPISRITLFKKSSFSTWEDEDLKKTQNFRWVSNKCGLVRKLMMVSWNFNKNWIQCNLSSSFKWINEIFFHIPMVFTFFFQTFFFVSKVNEVMKIFFVEFQEDFFLKTLLDIEVEMETF